MYRMTYNNIDGKGCSARGIAKRESEEELRALAEELKEVIYNVHIEQIQNPEADLHLPMDLFANMKELK